MLSATVEMCIWSMKVEQAPVISVHSKLRVHLYKRNIATRDNRQQRYIMILHGD